MSPDNNDTPDDESEDGEEEDVGQKEPDEDKEEEEREDEEETELPQPEDDETGIPPDTGFTFSADFIKKLEESLNPNIDVSQFIDVHRELEKYAETQKEMLKAATSHDIDLDQFKVTLPLKTSESPKRQTAPSPKASTRKSSASTKTSRTPSPTTSTKPLPPSTKSHNKEPPNQKNQMSRRLERYLKKKS
ncbi:hypothetical protein [Halalkalicoccus salilacus]|uniref:hypothetical protein n=1 Tax=Halalkalicoccus sp. GCM10025704 TaxID=3252662 RepID=UPI00360E6234